MNKFETKAFTLAETMIVIVVLGIIATLTIPALVNKQKESVAKTKLRKAMAAYESALNKMIIENDLKSDDTLTAWAGAVADCGNPTQYFKKVQGDGCIFKTSDGIWWNITDIERPLIAFKDTDLTPDKANSTTDMSAFVLVGRFGTDGSLRVDDLAYETNHDEDNSKAQVEKLYNLLGLKSTGAGGNTTPSPFEACNGADTCVVDGIEYTKIALTSQSEEYEFCYPEDFNEDEWMCGEEGDKWQTGTSESLEGTYWATNLGGNISWNDAQTACTQGTHLATRAELQSLYNSGNLNCLDGSKNCYFWSAEENNNNCAYIFVVDSGHPDDCDSKSYSNNGLQVLCIGQ